MFTRFRRRQVVTPEARRAHDDSLLSAGGTSGIIIRFSGWGTATKLRVRGNIATNLEWTYSKSK